MKAINLIVIFLLFLGQGSMSSLNHSIPVYPIPSTNVVVDGFANFENQISTPPQYQDGKRQVHIRLTSVSATLFQCEATVWVYSLDERTVLGPFTATCGIDLTVDIDEREWGVLVESEIAVNVDVWITEE